MQLAIAKPDWHIVGGFELLLNRLVAGLEGLGIEITMMPVEVLSTARAPYGVVVPDDIWNVAPEYFRYLSVLDTFRRMEFPSGTDCVLSTQPPSFAVREHPQLSIFFHHLRVYYDLSDAYVAGGFVDPVLHERARSVIHQVDQAALGAVDGFLVASEEVATRLEEFNQVRAGVRRFRPPPILSGLDPSLSDRGWSAPMDGGPVLCVSRHEFPKRVELFVQAMHLKKSLHGVVVGTGGRESFARHLDAEFEVGALDPGFAAAEEVWLNRGEWRPDDEAPVGRIEFAGRVDERVLVSHYNSAVCVVAPAYREDYGLTALEAMSFGKPVIVCTDGGGLAELVEDGVSGFVVEPHAQAIAAAVERVAGDAGLRSEMGAAARERASTFTWRRAVNAVVQSVLDVLDR